MKTFIYTIESEYDPTPQVLLFATRDDMRKRFIQDIIEDKHDPFGEEDVHREEGEDFAGPTLLQLIVARDTGKPIDEQFAMAAQIYEEVTGDGSGGRPYYHGFMDEDGWEVPEPPAEQLGPLTDPNPDTAERYTIYPDAPGHPDTGFKVFADGIKVATLTAGQVQRAMHDHRVAERHYRILLDAITEIATGDDSDFTEVREEALNNCVATAQGALRQLRDGTIPANNAYTVIFLYPDFASIEYGHDTYMGTGVGSTPEEAIADALGRWNKERLADDENLSHYLLEDVHCIACIEGEHRDLKP